MLCITESWLNSRTPSSLLIGDLPYIAIRRDRCTGRGGGTVLRDHFHYTVVDCINRNIECLAIDLLTSSSLAIRICIVYRPPNYSIAQTESLIDCLTDLVSTSSSPIIFIGDFNSDTLSTPTTTIDVSLNSFVSSAALSHLITAPTRNTRCIDWLLTSDSTIISAPTIIPSFPSSDHSGISFSIDYHSLPPSQSLIRDYARANYDDLSSYLFNIDWFSLFSVSPDPDSMYSSFVTIIHQAIDLFIPYHKPKPTVASYPPHIQKLIHHRNILFSKIHLLPVRNQYERCSRDLLNQIKKWNQFCERKKLKHSKDLYRHIRSLTKPKSIIPKQLHSSTGSIVSALPEISNLLASCFASHFTLDDGIMPSIPSHPLPPFLSNVSFLPHDVHRALKKLSPSCSTGYDKIPQIVFRKCAHALSLPLCDIFNISMLTGIVPSLWKHSLITPLPKPEKDAKFPDSYRPISILSPASKTMERLVKEKFAPYLFRFDVIPKYQHGYRPGASVLTNVIDSENDWTLAHSRNQFTDVIYLDFSRAFDTVPFTKLLSKCSHYGIHGNLLDWIASFITDRHFSVRLGDCISQPFPVLSGVPQGSVLGPILFTLYVSDITHVLSKFPDVRIQAYADDIKLYISYPLASAHSMTSQLQTALDAIHSWTIVNQLSLSESKCTHLHIGSSPPIYKINNVALLSKCPQRDLGIQVLPSLLRNASVVDRASKAKTALYIMLRAVSVNSSEILIKCYRTYVLPHLDFACPFWNPYIKKDSQTLEKVQEQFTRILFYRCFPSSSYPVSLPSYSERLSFLGLQALSERRVIFDLVFARRLMNGDTVLDRNRFFTYKPLRDRSNTFGIHIEFTKSTPRFHCFSRRIARILNELPTHIHCSSSIDVYKKRLLELDLSRFIIYR
jgi:hypothetical protein